MGGGSAVLQDKQRERSDYEFYKEGKLRFPWQCWKFSWPMGRERENQVSENSIQASSVFPGVRFDVVLTL